MASLEPQGPGFAAFRALSGALRGLKRALFLGLLWGLKRALSGALKRALSGVLRGS